MQFMIKFVLRGLVCFPLDSVFILSSSGFHLSGSRNLQIRAVEISDRITSCLRETLMLVWWYKGQPVCTCHKEDKDCHINIHWQGVHTLREGGKMEEVHTHNFIHAHGQITNGLV